eukprot:g1616.t1
MAAKKPPPFFIDQKVEVFNKSYGTWCEATIVAIDTVLNEARIEYPDDKEKIELNWICAEDFGKGWRLPKDKNSHSGITGIPLRSNETVEEKYAKSYSTPSDLACSRREVKRAKSGVRFIENRFEERINAATSVQRSFRHNIAQKQFQPIKKKKVEAAAISIEKLFRKQYHRRKFLKEKGAATLLKNNFRKKKIQSEFKKQKKAANSIGKVFREHHIREEFRKATDAATPLENNFRKHKGQSDFPKKKNAATLLSKTFRVHRDKDKFVKSKNAAIQRTSRQRLSQHKPIYDFLRPKSSTSSPVSRNQIQGLTADKEPPLRQNTENLFDILNENTDDEDIIQDAILFATIRLSDRKKMYRLCLNKIDSTYTESYRSKAKIAKLRDIAARKMSQKIENWLPMSHARLDLAIKNEREEQKRLKKYKSSRSVTTEFDENNIRSVFDRYDTNGNGSINVDALQNLLTELNVTTYSKRKIFKFLNEANDDDALTFEEFVKLLKVLKNSQKDVSTPTLDNLMSMYQVHHQRTRGSQFAEMKWIGPSTVYVGKAFDAYYVRPELGKVGEGWLGLFRPDQKEEDLEGQRFYIDTNEHNNDARNPIKEENKETNMKGHGEMCSCIHWDARLAPTSPGVWEMRYYQDHEILGFGIIIALSSTDVIAGELIEVPQDVRLSEQELCVKHSYLRDLKSETNMLSSFALWSQALNGAKADATKHFDWDERYASTQIERNAERDELIEKCRELEEMYVVTKKNLGQKHSDTQQQLVQVHIEALRACEVMREKVDEHLECAKECEARKLKVMEEKYSNLEEEYVQKRVEMKRELLEMKSEILEMKYDFQESHSEQRAIMKAEHDTMMMEQNIKYHEYARSSTAQSHLNKLNKQQMEAHVRLQEALMKLNEEKASNSKLRNKIRNMQDKLTTSEQILEKKTTNPSSWSSMWDQNNKNNAQEAAIQGKEVQNKDVEKQVKNTSTTPKSMPKAEVTVKMLNDKVNSGSESNAYSGLSGSDDLKKWKHMICPTSGRDYWYNEETDESVWHDPNLSKKIKADDTASLWVSSSTSSLAAVLDKVTKNERRGKTKKTKDTKIEKVETLNGTKTSDASPTMSIEPNGKIFPPPGHLLSEVKDNSETKKKTPLTRRKSFLNRVLGKQGYENWRTQK